MFPSASLYVVLQPSQGYALALALAHGLALLALALSPGFSPWLKLAVAVAVALCCWTTVARQALLASDDAVVRLTWSGEDYYLTTAGGDLIRARLVSRVALRWLLALNFRETVPTPFWRRRNYPVIILPGMVPAPSLRRLQVFFRWHAQP